jgi:RNA polymerase sigma-B factor
MTNGTGRRHTPAARTPRPSLARSGDHSGARDARLLAAVREHDDPDALQALVSEYLGLVWRIARRTAVRDDQLDDLVQEGVVGLLKAIRRFEPRRGTPFSAYAFTLVAGEISHHLRDRSSTLRLPEPVRELRGLLRRLADEARAETGHEPDIAELAALAGVSDEAVSEAVTAAVVPLEVDLPASEEELARSEGRADLEARLARLDRREREVVYLRFFADLTQQEIGACLGISQMHVSRVLRGALEKMRGMAGDVDD